MTKKYKVYAICSYVLTAEIEAESEEQAWDIAYDLEGDQFKEVDNCSDWQIDQVSEIT